jgi:hypothetical protein
MDQPSCKTYSNGDKEWYLDGRLHRIDGPAIERANGHKEWWLDHEEVPWQQVYHRAKEEDRLSILIAALTTS